jgi:hypothetical protein
MNLQRNSPAYLHWGRKFLEANSEIFTGVPYDENNQALTANEVAKFSGLSPEAYNRASQQLFQAQRFTNQQKR